MFETLRKMFKKGIIRERHLDNAVSKGWITLEDKG